MSDAQTDIARGRYFPNLTTAAVRTHRVLAEVEGERQYQNTKWGGATHDDHHAPDDWLRFLDEHVGKARSAAPVGWPEYRQRLLEVAALAVAAVETLDRRIGNG